MLKKKERLTKKEFDRSFSLGSRRHGKFVTVVYAPSKCFHGAVVVGKKVSKKAVVRNKLRRRLYNALYRLSRKNNIDGTYIILAKPAASEAEFVSLKNDLLTSIKSFKK